MKGIVITSYPSCPKCKKGKLLPLSGYADPYGSSAFALPIARWKCNNCSKSIKTKGEEHDD